jgi:hypothetical protein
MRTFSCREYRKFVSTVYPMETLRVVSSSKFQTIKINIECVQSSLQYLGILADSLDRKKFQPPRQSLCVFLQFKR